MMGTMEVRAIGRFVFPDTHAIAYGIAEISGTPIQFDERFRGLDSSFGLRTIPSLEATANRHSFTLRERKGMPAGNWWLVFVKDS
jgi:hypothetical protein